MNAIEAIDRLALVESEVDRLQDVLLDRQRAACDLTGDELDAAVAEACADAARTELLRKLTEHFILSRFLLSSMRRRETRAA